MEKIAKIVQGAPAKPMRPKLTPKQFFTTGAARELPFKEAWLNPNWDSLGFACVVVARRHPNGRIACAGFLIDVFCLGIKNTLFEAELPPAMYQQWLVMFYLSVGGERKPLDYPAAHHLVWGASTFAGNLGFSGHPDFKHTQFILEEKDADVPQVQFEFGRDGLPLYYPGPNDDYAKVLKSLFKHAGEGNFDVVLPDGDTYLNLKLQGQAPTQVELLALIEEGDYEADDWDDDDEEEDE